MDSIKSSLLALCSVLESFDRQTVEDLAPETVNAFDTAVRNKLLIMEPGNQGLYRVRDDLRFTTLEQLRLEQPLLEYEIYTRAFELFLKRMQEHIPNESDRSSENNCIFYFVKLFPQLGNRGEWTTITRYIAAVRSAGLQLQRHRLRLDMFDGFVAVHTQDYARGEALLESLLSSSELDTDVRLSALSAMAQMYRNTTRYDRALETFEQLSLVAQHEAQPVFHGLALINMASVQNELENYEQALAFGLQSLAIFRSHGEQTREAFALYIVGLNAMYLGRWPVAQEHFDAAIERFEALNMDSGLSFMYWSRGFLAHLRGDVITSEAAYLHALRLVQDAETSDSLLLMDYHLRLGSLYHTQQRHDEAMVQYGYALDNAYQLRHEHRAAEVLYQTARVLFEAGRRDEARDTLERAIATVETLRGETHADVIKIGLLGTTQQIYEATVLFCLEQNRAEKAFSYVERARARAFLDLLATKSPELFDEVEQPIASLAEIQAALPDGTVLLEYYTTGVIPRGEHLVNMLPPENAGLREYLVQPANTLLFAITRDSFEVHRLALDPNSLRPQPYDPGPGRRLLGGRMPTHLYDRLIAPVQRLVDTATQLIIVPHGPLHYVPFAALRSPTGDFLLHSDGPALSFAPSATVLLRNCLARPLARGSGLLALGYKDEADDALLYSEAEARAIAEMLDGQAWIGPEPKRDRLIQHGRHARLLHIAGHAIFDVRDPLASHVRLGKDDTLSAREIIAELELDADVVTLSACTSGLSHVVAGDELLGLQRALLYAGAPTVVCSLWETGDLVSLLVMERFYSSLVNGRGVAPALCDAQIAVRELSGADIAATLERWRGLYPEYADEMEQAIPGFAAMDDAYPFADPFHWAPFMAIGRP